MKVLEWGSGSPDVVVLAAVHGDEPCGVYAMHRLDDLTLVKGRLRCVIVNEEAIKQGVRFVDEDLNRAMQSRRQTREGRLAAQLRRILDEADALLDIHSTFAPEAPVYTICEDAGVAVARKMGSDAIVTGLDQFHSGSTDEYMHRQGKVGICIECGPSGSAGAVEAAYTAIFSFLSAYGMVEKQDVAEQVPVLVASRLYRNVEWFRLVRDVADLEYFAEKTIIGYDGAVAVYAEAGEYILFAQEREDAGEECFVVCCQKTI
ncbi:MAG: hypothetical protein ACOCWQ_03855 [Nanoarchaeota archaeon]